MVALHVALRYTERVAGVVALSTYLPEAGALEKEWSDMNRRIPIFQAHGLYDPMIPPELGELTKQGEFLSIDVSNRGATDDQDENSSVFHSPRKSTKLLKQGGPGTSSMERRRNPAVA